MSHTKKPTIEKIILALLGLLALAALVRTMFLGLEIDEEYALSLGFRLVRGDRLFYSMWEPHQLAALPPALLIGLFTAVAGTTTGVLLFVRGAVLAVKLALAVWFYRSLRVALGGRCAYLLALAVLAFTPKWFLGPDYVSQQFHFTLAAFLFLYGYYAPGPRQYRGLWRVAAGGVCACLSFLAYPQTLAAAPVLMLALLLLGRGSADKCRGLWVFVLACAVPKLCLVLETGWHCEPITAIQPERITRGPAAGTWADTKAADMQECLYEALAPYAGKSVLQAIGEQHGLGFLMADGTLTVAQASVISGTDSDPRFEQYYALLPEKQPDVILYDDAEVRDMAEFHAWIEQHFTITDRYTVQHGTASLQVLVVG